MDMIPMSSVALNGSMPSSMARLTLRKSEKQNFNLFATMYIIKSK